MDEITKGLDDTDTFFHKWKKKIFTIPFMTCLGVWIIVYYQFTSHYHRGIGKTIKYSWGYISGSVNVENDYHQFPLKVRLVR